MLTIKALCARRFGAGDDEDYVLVGYVGRAGFLYGSEAFDGAKAGEDFLNHLDTGNRNEFIDRDHSFSHIMGQVTDYCLLVQVAFLGDFLD